MLLLGSELFDLDSMRLWRQEEDGVWRGERFVGMQLRYGIVCSLCIALMTGWVGDGAFMTGLVVREAFMAGWLASAFMSI
jgi:hypothetical protein